MGSAALFGASPLFRTAVAERAVLSHEGWRTGCA